MSEYFLHQISLICLSQYCALMCCFVLYLLDMSNWRKRELQERISQLNTKLILTEQQVPPLLWRHYFYVYLQHSTVIFQVIIVVRPVTLVMGKISYADKARIETLRKLGFGYRTIVAKFQKRARSFAQWKQFVNGLMSMGRQRNKSQVAVSRKQHEQRKMLDILSCWLAKIEHWIWCCSTSPNIKLIE